MQRDNQALMAAMLASLVIIGERYDSHQGRTSY
jgi:hypothetical protein